MIEIKLDPPAKDLKIFSLILMPFSVLAGFLIAHYSESLGAAWGVGSVLFVLGLSGAIWPKTVRWFFVAWMIAAFPIGWTVSHLVLALVFYGMFLPIGWIAKCFGYDPLQMKQSEADSYWQELEPVENKEQYFRQF